MKYQTTLTALQQLFPITDINPTEETLEESVKAPKIRDNGVLECNYDHCGYHLDAQVASEQLIEAVKIVDQNGFFIESITGVDWIKEDQLEAVYDFCRYDEELCRVVIRVRIPRDNPQLPTITEIYAGANWHERETHDFFGIKFEGHPNLIPLLLPEDADFHPLLKDFKP